MRNELQQNKKNPLPKIEELYLDLELSAKQNDLNKLLNCNPKPEWIKQNKFANNSSYIPVGIIEYLLTSIFIKWRVEVKTVQVIANSVQVTVRLHVLDPITGEWDWQDGVGASPIQTKQGAAATDFTQVTTAAVQMAAPAAESYAFKDAAEKFGKLFGKDINRQSGNVDYFPMMDGRFKEVSELPGELLLVIAETTDADKLSEIYKNNPEYHSNPLFMKKIYERKTELNGTVNA